MKRITLAAMLLYTIACLPLHASGCGGLARDKIIKHPDAPMMITEGKGKLRVSVWDGDQEKLIDYGWIAADHVQGWTLDKFDWDEWEGEQE